MQVTVSGSGYLWELHVPKSWYIRSSCCKDCQAATTITKLNFVSWPTVHYSAYTLNWNKTTWGWGWAEQQAAAHTEKQSDHSETSLQETADHRLHSAPRAGWRPSWELKYGLKNLTRHGDPLEVDWVVHVGSFPVKIDIQYFQTFFLDSVIKPDSWISSLPRI